MHHIQFPDQLTCLLFLHFVYTLCTLSTCYCFVLALHMWCISGKVALEIMPIFARRWGKKGTTNEIKLIKGGCISHSYSKKTHLHTCREIKGGRSSNGSATSLLYYSNRRGLPLHKLLMSNSPTSPIPQWQPTRTSRCNNASRQFWNLHV